MPMKTMLVSDSEFSTLSTWLMMVVAERLPWNPWRPVMQKAQCILHPACEEMQSVARSWSGM